MILRDAPEAAWGNPRIKGKGNGDVLLTDLALQGQFEPHRLHGKGKLARTVPSERPNMVEVLKKP